MLDEPTNGLDPQGTREVRNLVGSLADGGTTVLVSSHLLSEVEQMCTHIGVMHVGKLVAQGTSAELRSGTEAEAVVETDQPAEAARIMRELGLSDVRQSPLGRSGTHRQHRSGEGRRGMRPPGRRRHRVQREPALAGGRVRLTHGGGLRCQWLSTSSRTRRPSRRRPSGRFLRSELRLIFFRRRNQAGLLVLAGVPILIAIAVKLSTPGRDRGGPDFFTSITENGLFVALAALTIELGLFLRSLSPPSPATRWRARPTSARCATCSPCR